MNPAAGNESAVKITKAEDAATMLIRASNHEDNFIIAHHELSAKAILNFVHKMTGRIKQSKLLGDESALALTGRHIYAALLGKFGLDPRAGSGSSTKTFSCSPIELKEADKDRSVVIEFCYVD